jgi:hypothetical protein
MPDQDLTQYPETKPQVQDLTSFHFNPLLAKEEKERLENHAEALQDRIDRIVKRVRIGPQEMPLVGYITQLTHDKDEILLLSRALKGVAPLLEEYDDIREKLDALEFIEGNVPFLASVFGDFSSTVDNIDMVYKDWTQDAC